jgi:hypothetical protein
MKQTPVQQPAMPTCNQTTDATSIPSVSDLGKKIDIKYDVVHDDQ